MWIVGPVIMLVLVVILVVLNGCAVAQPSLSVGAGYVTHERISKIEKQVDKSRIDLLELRVLELERRMEEGGW